MKKRKKRNLPQRITAVLLSAALIVGLEQSIVPINALAQERAGENTAESTEEEGKPSILITSNQEWGTRTLAAGTYTIDSGVTVTMTGTLTVSGDVTIEGGGKLVRGDAAACFVVSGGNLTLQDMEIDGASILSSNAMITVSGSGNVTLDKGCWIHHCYKNEDTGRGAVLNLSSSTAVFQDAIIENCQSKNYGGAIYMADGSSLAIYGGTYQENSTTYSSSFYGGGFIYNRASTLEIYDGRFINNTSTGKGGCIYNTGITNTKTYLYGGYFQGNKSTYTGSAGQGSGALYYSSENTADTVISLSGNVQFCGDGEAGSGIDGIFLDLASNAARKIYISSELKYPIELYLTASEGRAIAQGVDEYILLRKDMKKISFTDVGSSGSEWYAKLDRENNQVILTKENPGYGLYVTYVANGGSGNVLDDGEYSSGNTVTVQSGDGLQRASYKFVGWNTEPDGTGTAYQADETFEITDDVTLYAQWTLLNTVTYDYSTNGGSSATQSVLGVDIGEKIDLTPTAEKENWKFVGWNTDKDAKEGLEFESLIMEDSDIILYAIYKRTLTAAFYSGSIGCFETLTETFYNNDTPQWSFEMPALKEWAESDDSGYEAVDWLSEDTTESYSSGDTITLEEDTNFYGRYNKIITISYHENGGTGSVADQTETIEVVMSDKNVDYGEIVLKDGTGLSRTGYIFDGWYDNEDCIGTAVTSISGAVIGNQEYWAKWTDKIAPVIGTLKYNYQPKNLWQQLIGKDSLIITVPVTEEGSGAEEISYTMTSSEGEVLEQTAEIKNGFAEITVSPDFKGTIAITCTDHAGNVSASIMVGAEFNATDIIIEDNAPQISFAADNKDISEDEYDAAPDITVTVADDKDNAISAGIASIIYQIGNDEERAVEQDFAAALVTESSFIISADEIPRGKTVITVTAVDNAGNKNIVTQSILIHTHSYGKEWKSDETNHWRECIICKEKSEEAVHNYGEWNITKPATEEEEGLQERSCTVCQYKETEVIPKLTHTHNYGTEWKSNEIKHWRECDCGVKSEEAVHSYGAWTIIKEATEEEEGLQERNCAVCQYKETEVIPKLTHVHNYGTEWKSNETNHWRECDCGAKSEEAVHNYGAWTIIKAATEEEEGLQERNCTVCQYKETEVIPKLTHTHNYGTEWKSNETNHWHECICGAKSEEAIHSYDAWTVIKEATEEEEGLQERSCAVCQYKETKVIPKLTHVHNYGTEWKTDETNHWRECICGAKSEEAVHSYGVWTIIKPATMDEEGLQERSCTICEYKNSELIPKTEDKKVGKIDMDVQTDGKAPATQISTPEKELKDMLLTDEEKQQVANGTNIDIILEVKDASESVSSEDKTNLEKALNGYTTGQYLDINLYKLIGRSRTDITETAVKITITITIPDNLKSTDSKTTRTFAITRVHNGIVEFLNDFDNDADTITIQTDRFSTYAIVYKDTKEEVNNTTSSDKNTNPAQIENNEPKTGDNTPLELYATLVMITGFVYLLLYFSKRRVNRM